MQNNLNDKLDLDKNPFYSRAKRTYFIDSKITLFALLYAKTTSAILKLEILFQKQKNQQRRPKRVHT